MSPNSSNDEDNFFDMLSKFQGRRLDDQRTSLRIANGTAPHHRIGKYETESCICRYPFHNTLCQSLLSDLSYNVTEGERIEIESEIEREREREVW